MRPITQIQPATLLRDSDPEPVMTVNADSAGDVVLVCEHAGRVIPQALGDLGVSPADMDRHIAYDVGAEAVAREMAVILEAPLVLQPYSRLVIDCNRPVEAPDAIPTVSDSTPVPANQRMDSHERLQRISEIFVPFQDAVTEVLNRKPRRAVFAVHSFTPVLGRDSRPWDLAFVFRGDADTSHALATAVAKLDPTLRIGMNEPYSVDDNSDWFVPYHGERSGLAHSLIEIRNDHLASEDACRAWARLLSTAITQVLERPAA